MRKLLLISLYFFTVCVSAAFAQNRSVNGTVRSKDDNSSIPGASILVKGTHIGTVTDSNGQYTLKNVPEGSALIFSFIGYDVQVITLKGSDRVDVSLKSNSNQLGEVVVNGYGTQSKRVVTGSVGQVKGADLADKDYASLDQSLQGRVAGLQSVGTSGQPGALQQIRIRGIGSISADANPLYVIDGIIINSGDLSRSTSGAGASTDALAGINPSDIESINVLKDASATAI